ncbi:hypothetical protein VINI7043_07565 [Vibrio nigripulchritudo ATCC 27043]|uniref:hypothetical protein n=1 Tax=Vibrio nigripulchritudo TaxID=28173 RepID=UPI00021C1F76|nr:hypothetical protein [Vibrio nigripulchritudo]EGU57653.1 hypothetical protein VINI7043_07565 [Vibrio nigripulchritudo ATCC 27043]
MSDSLDWKYGKPEVAGIYFVAIKLGEGIGRYDFLLWSGREWETDQKAEIIAFVDADEVKRVLNPKWPEKVEGVSYNSTISDSDGELWEEA